MKTKLRPVLKVLLTMLLVFSLIGTSLSVFGYGILMRPDYLISKVEHTNTYENTYHALMKKFEEQYNATAIPVAIIEEAVTPDWTRNAINAQIQASFAQFDDETAQPDTDYSAIADTITAFFEEYAHENHAIKDETYQTKLKESIDNTTQTVASAIDVYRLETMKKAGILAKIGKVRALIPTVMYGCIGATVVLMLLLLLLKKPVYWLGTALFAAGLITTLPTAYVILSDLVERFSFKEYTTFTLVTGTMNHLVETLLTIGIGMSVIGCIFIGISLLKRKS